MNITVKTDNPKKLAQDAIDAHLYIDKWSLILKLEDIVSATEKDYKKWKISPHDIAVAYSEDQPVGVMVLADWQFNTYVKPEYRRKGIGTMLYAAIIKITKKDYKNIVMREGEEGSLDFFDKVGHLKIDMESTSYSKPRYLSW